MWKLALRNVLRHKSRTAMTLLAIIGGVVSLILSGGFIADIIDQFGEILIHSQSGHIQVARVGYFAQGARSPEKYAIRDPEPIRQTISALPMVDDVMERLYFTGLLNNGRADQPIIGEGIEPARETRLGTGLILAGGRHFQDGDKLAMMVGKGLAHALNLKPGGIATLVTNTPDGAVNSLEFEVVGVFQTFSKDYDAHAVRIPLAAAHELLATTGVNTLVVALRQTAATDTTAATLNTQLTKAGLEAKTWIELNDFYANTVAMYDAQFGVLRFIILVMVLLSVANSVNMSVFERVGEFGTMMALGNRSRHVFALIVAENTITGLVGAGLGAALGIGLALIVSAIGISMPPPPNSDMAYVAHIRIVPAGVASAFLIGFVATVGAALLPAARIRSIPVVDALRQNI